MRQTMTVSQLQYKPFPLCTKLCMLYGMSHNCYECKLVCSSIKQITESDILKVESRESVLV